MRNDEKETSAIKFDTNASDIARGNAADNGARIGITHQQPTSRRATDSSTASCCQGDWIRCRNAFHYSLTAAAEALERSLTNNREEDCE